MSEWHGRRIVILGLGASGRAALTLLRQEGAVLSVADAREPEPALRREWESSGIRWLAPTVPLNWEGDAAIVSPGIPETHPWIQALRRQGVPLLSELELGWRFRGSSRILAITGSNGKSTLVRLCAGAFRRAGRTAREAGNCGPPLSAVVREPPVEWLVLEVSSFQLETVSQFCPDIGLWLNLYPNHLDRHGTIGAYAALKARMFQRQGPSETAILHESVKPWMRGVERQGMRCCFFGLGRGNTYRYEEGHIVMGEGGAHRLEIRGTRFDNLVLGPAVAAATAVMDAAGLPVSALAEEIREFQPLPHRMEMVDEIHGVRFINDSKGTNLAALEAALSMMDRPVRLVAGGRLKEGDVGRVKELLQSKCIKVYVIGESAERLRSAWNGAVDVEICHDLETAVRRAWEESHAGEAVLLSPAAASFDQYPSFEQRGEHFRCIVRRLRSGMECQGREARKK